MKVDVPSAALRTGALVELGICARHGTPATRSRTRRFSTSPPAALVLLAFFSFFLVLLLFGLFQKETRGPIPECDRCARTYRRRLTTLWVGVIGGIVLFVVGLAQWPPLALVGLVAFLVGIVVGVMADLARVRGDLASDLMWVELRGVSAEFAEVAAGKAYAAAIDPWAVPLR